jgi:CBS domain containing-hemolysin-like protein
VVVDEFGGTSGIITLEDVVEQMIGHISGPYDTTEEKLVVPLSPGRWRVRGDLPVHEWDEAFGAAAQISSVSTVGGLVMARLGRVPVEGDEVHVGNLALRVEQMKGRRVASLLLELDPHDLNMTSAVRTAAASAAMEGKS